MANPPFKLSSARVLITNDDGIGAPMIEHLMMVARQLAGEVWTVAPATEQSAAGHSLTLRRPLKIERHGRRRFSIDGTPTDCVLMAVNWIMRGHRPDLVLSGINWGSNLGEDMTYSGTIAAAMEATLLGIPAIALSQSTEDLGGKGKGRLRWSVAEEFAPGVIARVTSIAWPRDVLVNVNFPAGNGALVAGVKITHEGRREIGENVYEGEAPDGIGEFWIGGQRHSETYAPGSDLDAAARGWISVTPISLDLTHRPTMKALKKVFP